MAEPTYRLFQLALSCVGLLSGIILFILAIWRDAFTKRIIRPALVLEPRDFPHGEGTILRSRREDPDSSTADERDSEDDRFTYSETDARYWHVQVINDKPWIQADEVELFLITLSIGDEGHEIEQPMPGALPIKARRNHGSVPIGFKPVVYDLFRFVEGRGLEFLFFEGVPNNLQHRLDSAGSFTAILQARGHNAESNKLWVRVQWNGERVRNRLDDASVQITPRMISYTTSLVILSKVCFPNSV